MAFFPDQGPSDGNMALVSQSGSQAIILYRLARARGIPFNKIVSSGNEADLECIDFLDYFSRDPKVNVITAYIEGVRAGRRFVEVGRNVSLHKPVIVFKVGGTAAGGRAASSHTGAMSGMDAIWKSVLRQTGMISAGSVSELLDIALGFSLISAPIGRRVAIMGGPGGSSVISADACERYGLKVASLEADTTSRLRDILPPVGTSIQNPIDMGFGAVADGIYEDVLRVVNADRNVDVVLALGGAPTFAGKSYIRIEEFAEEVIASKPFLTKPLLTVVPHISQTQNAINMLAGGRIPVFSEPDHAANAIAKMAVYYECLEKKIFFQNIMEILLMPQEH
jgi:acyl-CoA synthetase (NDP forming)